MSLRFVLLAALTCPIGRAAADRSVHVDARDAPFSATELEAALRVRLPPGGSAVAVTVVGAGGRVDVAIGDTTRAVELDGRTGAAAARLVALAVVDLALDDLAVAPSVDPSRTTLVLDLLGAATSWSGALAGVTGGITLAHGHALGAIELTGNAAVAGTLEASSVVVRACAGFRLDQLDVRGGAVIAPMWVTNGLGDQTTLVGLTLNARVHLPLADNVGFVAAVGLDAYATQTTYVIGTTMVATPWVAPWVAAGIEVTP